MVRKASCLLMCSFACSLSAAECHHPSREYVEQALSVDPYSTLKSILPFDVLFRYNAVVPRYVSVVITSLNEKQIPSNSLSFVN